MRIYLQLLRITTVMILLISSCRDINKSPHELDEFTPYILKKMSEYQVPGVAIGIIQGKQLIFSRGFGYSNLQRQQPVTPNTLFAIGSTTKAMTAVSLCQLVEKGILDLDLPIVHYLPQFKLYDKYVSDHITTRDLLCHRSGLPRHDMMWYGSSLSRKEIIHRLKFLEPSKGFRSQFQYQNMMYVAAGSLLEKITGNSWEQYTQKNLLSPLKMDRTNFSVSTTQRDSNHATPYGLIHGKTAPIAFRNIDAIGPAGSINSCIIDLSHWVIMQLNNGRYNNQQILSPKMLEETHTPQIIIPCTLDKHHLFYTYSLGWNLTSYRGHLRISHGGSIDGFIAEIALYPHDDLGIIILCNLDHSRLPLLLRNKLADHFLGLSDYNWDNKYRNYNNNSQHYQYVCRAANTQPPHNIKAYAGQYHHPAYGTLHITTDQNQLNLKYHCFKTQLTHYHHDVFEAQNTILSTKKFSFLTGEDGTIIGVSSPLQTGVDEIVFEKVSPKKK